MFYAYSNNGLSFRAVDPNYICQAGEVKFSGIATVDQLTQEFSGYAGAVASEAHEILVQQAKQRLLGTDVVASRCLKASIPFPSEWQTYTLALRVIANGTDTISQALPATPAYPAGT